MSLEPDREHPSTYFVADRSNQEELTRLHLQDQMLTAGMGGVLSEQPDPTIFEQVLDIGCGTGGWLIEAAKAYPTMKRLVGIDTNPMLIAYAQTQAEQAAVADRVAFQVMDALGRLAFPQNSFDLVNERFGDSFVRTSDWPGFLQECLRITRPGGVIRATECDLTENTSPAANRFYDLLLEALYQAGHFFTLDRRSMIDALAPLLRQHGVTQVQTRFHRLEYRAGTPECQSFSENVRHGLRTLRPFFQKWSQIPDDYETISGQALDEMQQPGFVATWTVLTAWGRKGEMYA